MSLINFLKENLDIHYNVQTKMLEFRLLGNFVGLYITEEGTLGVKCDLRLELAKESVVAQSE